MSGLCLSDLDSRFGYGFLRRGHRRLHTIARTRSTFFRFMSLCIPAELTRFMMKVVNGNTRAGILYVAPKHKTNIRTHRAMTTLLEITFTRIISYTSHMYTYS